MKRQNKSWSQVEDACLATLMHAHSIDELSKILGRTTQAVQVRKTKHIANIAWSNALKTAFKDKFPVVKNVLSMKQFMESHTTGTTRTVASSATSDSPSPIREIKRRSKRFKFSSSHLDTIKGMFAEGQSDEAIAAVIGCSIWQLQKVRRTIGKKYRARKSVLHANSPASPPIHTESQSQSQSQSATGKFTVMRTARGKVGAYNLYVEECGIIKINDTTIPADVAEVLTKMIASVNR